MNTEQKNILVGVLLITFFFRIVGACYKRLDSKWCKLQIDNTDSLFFYVFSHFTGNADMQKNRD